MCGDLETHIWLCEYVYLVMQGYGRDESAPTPGGMFVTNFVGERNIINKPFRMPSRNVRNVFVICVLHIRRVKVWFLRCKSMVFGVQKGGFCIAKVWFLQCKKGVFVIQGVFYLKCIVYIGGNRKWFYG